MGPNHRLTTETPRTNSDNRGQIRSKIIGFIGICRPVTAFGTQEAQVQDLARGCYAPAQRDNLLAISKSQCREVRPDGLCHITRRQMGVVLLGHPGIGMAELGGENAHRRYFEPQF